MTYSSALELESTTVIKQRMGPRPARTKPVRLPGTRTWESHVNHHPRCFLLTSSLAVTTLTTMGQAGQAAVTNGPKIYYGSSTVNVESHPHARAKETFPEGWWLFPMATGMYQPLHLVSLSLLSLCYGRQGWHWHGNSTSPSPPTLPAGELGP